MLSIIILQFPFIITFEGRAKLVTNDNSRYIVTHARPLSINLIGQIFRFFCFPLFELKT